MKERTARRAWTVTACVAGVIAFLVLAFAVMTRSGERTARAVKAELLQRAERPATRPAEERERVLGLARATRREPSRRAATERVGAHPAAPDAAAGEPQATAPLPASAPEGDPAPAPGAAPRPLDASLRRDPAERPVHDWLRQILRTREQPGPAPPREVTDVLDARSTELDAFARALLGTSGSSGSGDWDDDSDGAAEHGTSRFVEPGELDALADLERTRVLLLASACAEWLRASGDPARAERLLEAAWILGRGLPARMTDSASGELLLAILRQARVTNVRAWDERLDGSRSHRLLALALEDAALAELARREQVAERRRSRTPWFRRPLAELEIGADVVVKSRLAEEMARLARDVAALGECDDPWLLARSRSSRVQAIQWWPGRGHVRITATLAMASRAQDDLALTRAVLLRRHGIDPGAAACAASALVERQVGPSRFTIGWSVPDSTEPGPAMRTRRSDGVVFMRTWPEPADEPVLLEPFTFDAEPQRAPVLASAPAP